MRKQLFILGLAGLALTSCSNDEQIAESAAADADVITMRALVPNATRGIPQTTATLNVAGQSIKATCFKSDANGQNFTQYYANETFSFESGQFKSSTRHRYPDDSNVQLHHYAWYPVTATPTIADNAQSFTDFSPETAVADQKDLMLAINKTSTNTDKPNGTDLKFQHALSQIVLKAKAGDDREFDFQIGGAKLVNLLNKATLTWPAASTDKIPLSAWGSQAAHDANNIATYEVPFANGFQAKLDGTLQDLGTGYNQNFLILPQDNTNAAWDASAAKAGNDNFGTAIAVKLKITKKGSTDVVTTAEANGVNAAGEVWAYVPVTTKWEPGYKYIYTLDFTDGAGYTDGGDPILDKVIRYNCDVEEWVEASPAPTVNTVVGQ